MHETNKNEMWRLLTLLTILALFLCAVGVFALIRSTDPEGWGEVFGLLLTGISLTWIFADYLLRDWSNRSQTYGELKQVSSSQLY